jgi:hypothetical protein
MLSRRDVLKTGGLWLARLALGRNAWVLKVNMRPRSSCAATHPGPWSPSTPLACWSGRAGGHVGSTRGPTCIPPRPTIRPTIAIPFASPPSPGIGAPATCCFRAGRQLRGQVDDRGDLRLLLYHPRGGRDGGTVSRCKRRRFLSGEFYPLSGTSLKTRSGEKPQR